MITLELQNWTTLFSLIATFPLYDWYLWGINSVPLVQTTEIQSEDSTGLQIS